MQTFRKKITFVVLLITIFFDSLGYMILDPIISAQIGKSLGVQSGIIFFQSGLLLGVYAFAQFFATPILGAVSDKYGRKPVLVLSLVGTVFSRLLFVIGLFLSSWGLMIFSRALDGLTGANISAAESAVSDISDQNSRLKNFGWVASAVGLGLALGPIASLAFLIPIKRYVLQIPDDILISTFSVLLAVLNLVLLLLMMGETIKVKIDKLQIHLGDFNLLQKIKKQKKIREIFLIMLVFSFGLWMASYIKIYMSYKFGISVDNSGVYYLNLAYVYVGTWMIIAQIFLLRRYSKDKKNSVLKFMMLCVFGIFLLLFQSIPFPWNDHRTLSVALILLIAPLFAVGYGVVFPLFNSLLIETQGEVDNSGEILGTTTAILAFCQAIPPIIAGALAANFLELPILLGCGIMLLACLMSFNYNLKS